MIQWFVLLHLGQVAGMLVWLRPQQWRTWAEWQNWLLAGCISLFMPIMGNILLWLFRNQHVIPAAPPAEVKSATTPEQDALHYLDLPTGKEVEVGAGKGDERLNSLNIDHYLDLLMSSRELDSKRAVALLKEALGSKTESARLLAYALYSKKEQGDFRLLDELLNQLKQGQLKNPRLNLAIAQTYWHILDIGLVDPAVAKDVWEKVNLHAEVAMRHAPELWQPYWLRAQGYMKEEFYAQADNLLRKAVMRGASKERIEPLLAEVKVCLNRAKTINSLNMGANRA